MTEVDYSLKNYDPSVPLVSVVITTKNEEKNIEYCLESVRHQTWKHLEIIVIDNSSIDATVQIARKYTEKVYIKGPEISTAKLRNDRAGEGDIRCLSRRRYDSFADINRGVRRIYKNF